MEYVKVLVIDDEELIRQNVCSKISRLSHGVSYATYAAADIYTGFKMYEEINPDIIITDICMPDGTGLSLAQKVRDIDRNTPILVLSGFDDFSYVRQAFLIGVNDYLLKPLSLIELDDKLRLHIKVKNPRVQENQKAMSVAEMAVKFVEDNMERQVSLKEVCQIANMSYHYFSKIFKDAKGISFSHYVTMRKMTVARELLLDPTVRISEIAKKLGFENPNHFSRAFNNAFGKYPTQIRKELGEIIND